MQIIVNGTATTWDAFVANNQELAPEVLAEIKTGLDHGSQFEINLGASGVHKIWRDDGHQDATARPWELVVDGSAGTDNKEVHAFVQVAGSNAGDVIVEIWNPEDEQLANLRLIVAAVNAYKP